MPDALASQFVQPKYASTVAKEQARVLFLCQQQIVLALEGIDGSRFKQDFWQRSGSTSGSGLSCVLEEGEIFEKGAVLFSSVQGEKLPKTALTGSSGQSTLEESPFFATGLSLILHPHNPYVPAVHLNVRYFETSNYWWFGGGMDLTPFYPFTEDCIEFHQAAKCACDKFDPNWYARFKAWCDEYFYLPHRKECRGIGGIFFNHLRPRSQELGLEFLQSVIKAFLRAYPAIVKRRSPLSYGQCERDFLTYRRGRYVEFNLLYDQGTLFGLQSDGRVESIFMSMPPQVSWRYNWQPPPNSPEAKLTKHFLQPQDWANQKLP